MRRQGSDLATLDEIFVNQVYRPVLRHLEACEVMLDLGANIGLAALFFWRHYACRCFCVEANPATCRLLHRNVAAIGAQVLHAGAWSARTQLDCDCPSNHFSVSAVRPAPGGAVPGLPMADLIAWTGTETIDLLKVDIEGAEVELFHADLGWLHRVRAIAIEFHGASRDECDFDATMRALGFGVFDAGHTTVAIRPLAAPR